MILEHRFGHIPDDGRRRRAWIASLAPLFDASVDADTVVPDTAFHRYHHLGETVLGVYRTPMQVIQRTSDRVVAHGLDHLVLRTSIAGHMRVATGGASVEAGPGDLLVLDLAKPVRIEMDALDGVGFAIPWRLMGERPDARSHWHGRILDGGAPPLTRLVADHLCHLGRCVSSVTPAVMRDLVPAAVSLCRALVSTLGEHDGLAPDRGNEPVIEIAIRRFIDEHLAEVDVPMLTAHFGLSRTSLYRLFEHEGGVCAYIRHRRLSYAMRRLMQPGERRPKLARLAHECGFTGDLVFSRAFRRKYGLNPGEIVPDRSPMPVSDAPLLGWLREL